jgi:hypothetical protein
VSEDIQSFMASQYPRIRGRCPACHSETLFVGAGGYVTCMFLDCPNPGAASDWLENDRERARGAKA